MTREEILLNAKNLIHDAEKQLDENNPFVDFNIDKAKNLLGQAIAELDYFVDYEPDYSPVQMRDEALEWGGMNK